MCALSHKLLISSGCKQKKQKKNLDKKQKIRERFFNCSQHTLKNHGHQRTSTTCSASRMIVHVFKFMLYILCTSWKVLLFNIFRCSNQYLMWQFPKKMYLLDMCWTWFKGCFQMKSRMSSHLSIPLLIYNLVSHDIFTSVIIKSLLITMFLPSPWL